MKFTTLAVLTCATFATAKNVFTPADLEAALEKEKGNEKREAKNVIEMTEFFEKKTKRNQMAMQGTAPLLQNLLPQVSSVSIFAGYLRDDQKLLSQIETTGSFTLLIAPSDDAVSSKLNGLKPWEFPRKVQDDETDDAVIAYNINHFLMSHIAVLEDVKTSENEITTTLLTGEEVTIRKETGTDTYKVKYKGQWIPVTAVFLADNGTVFVIGDILSKP